jgi:hypothetical protein
MKLMLFYMSGMRGELSATPDGNLYWLYPLGRPQPSPMRQTCASNGFRLTSAGQVNAGSIWPPVDTTGIPPDPPLIALTISVSTI